VNREQQQWRKTMWGYPPMYPQSNPSDQIVAKIIEEWWESKKDKKDKKDKDDEKKIKIRAQEILETWFLLVLSTPFVVIFWKVVEWGWSRLIP
jgi:hypothetical protein